MARQYHKWVYANVHILGRPWLRVCSDGVGKEVGVWIAVELVIEIEVAENSMWPRLFFGSTRW